MRIAFVQCPAYGIDAPPVGIAYLSSYLRSKGYETKVFDFNIEQYNKEGKSGLWEPWQINLWLDKDKIEKFPFFSETLISAWAEQVLAYDTKIICFSLQGTSTLFSIALAKKIRERDNKKIIIFGGPSSFRKHSNQSFETDYNIHEYADALVIGEGEETLLEIIKQVEMYDKLTGANGSILIKDNKAKEFPDRESIRNLDELPIPDYSEFRLEDYRDCKKGKIRMLSSRGCPNKCVFCTDTMLWKKYRTRSAENILEEFKLRKKQGFKFIEFNDSTMNGDLETLSELCDKLIKEKSGIEWGGSARVNPMMSISFFKKMKKAGCKFINYGIESASSNVLKKMNKQITSLEASKAVIKTRLAGIKVYTNWIIGFPNESRLDFLKTLLFVILHRPFISEASVAMCFINPHSLMEKYPEQFDIVYDEKRNWHTTNMKNNLKERRQRMDAFLLLTKLLGYNIKFKIKQE